MSWPDFIGTLIYDTLVYPSHTSRENYDVLKIYVTFYVHKFMNMVCKNVNSGNN